MSNKTLNPKIMKGIKKNCEDDRIKQFLEQLLLKEADRNGMWWWKQEYRDAIKRFSEGE